MINEQAKFIIEQLNINGFECYVVGGAVRDSLLEKKVHDYDFTTNAKPDEIRNVFSDFPLINAGEKHGTIGVCIGEKVYEITTYRIDGDYVKNRKPEKVEFSSSLIEDLKRRDFTINSLCFSPKSGIIDYFNGKNDLENKIIRTVGNPKDRFEEDALRILRALRFSAELGFEIEANTSQAIFETTHLLKNISAERIFSELCKILLSENASIILNKYKKVLFEIIPELAICDNFSQNSLSHTKDVFEHTLWVISNCSSNLVLRLSALFHDAGKPFSYTEGNDGYRHFYNHWDKSKEIAEKVLSRLRAKKTLIKQVGWICKFHDEGFETKYEIKKALNSVGKDVFKILLEHKKADIFAHSDHGIKKYIGYYENTLKLFNEIIENDECYSLAQLNFNGNDALNLNISLNKIKEVLNQLLDLVMQGKLENEFNILNDFVIHNFT